ncbi:golgi-body localization protein domain-containing protein [Lipomyces japonicus]|uniref:golgi-body localization protein domain-containing protein n=1 Tax=Lipomyces japonicus TaxID=56871 RepID=UPI0034CE6841
MKKTEGVSLVLIELGAVFCLIQLVAFFVFAIFRILTGISIQRLGYFSLRHISFVLKLGVHVEINRIKLDFHRPAFSSLSWVTLTVSDISVIFDNPYIDNKLQTTPTVSNKFTSLQQDSHDVQVTNILAILNRSIKTVHKYLYFIKLIDLSIKNVSLITSELGTVQIRSLALNSSVKNGDLTKLPHFFSMSRFEQPNFDDGKSIALLWRFAIKDIFHSPGKNSSERILDIFQIDLSELFLKQSSEIVDIGTNIYVGHFTLPYDIFKQLHASFCARRARNAAQFADKVPKRKTVICESNQELLDSAKKVIKVVREARIHFSKIGIYKIGTNSRSNNKNLNSVYLNFIIKDFTLDVKRLSSRSAGHRLYFEQTDISHQIVLTALSIAVGLDDHSSSRKDELVYVPMIAMTVTTNWLKKTIEIFAHEEIKLNSSIMKGSLTLTAPSVDLHACHLPFFFAMLATKPRPSSSTSTSTSSKTTAVATTAALNAQGARFAKFLPKAIIKLNIEEPALRIIVSEDGGSEYTSDSCEDKATEKQSFQNILCSACSTISCEIESSHLLDPSLHYNLTAAFRLTDFLTYVRLKDGPRNDLLRLETFSLKVNAETSPGLDVLVHGYLSSIGVYLTKPEIINGLKELLGHVRREAIAVDDIYHSDSNAAIASHRNLIKLVPSWISSIKIEGSDVLMSASCVDDTSPVDYRSSKGAALQIESWLLDYKPRVSHKYSSKYRRHQNKSISQGSVTDDISDSNDRRKLSFGVKDVNIFCIDQSGTIDQESPFLVVPDIEVSVLVSDEELSQKTEIIVILNIAFLNYSLFHHYSLLLCAKALQKIFRSGTNARRSDSLQNIASNNELVFVEIRTQNIRAKISLPKTPQFLLQFVGLNFCKNSTSIPIFKSAYIRLFVTSTTSPDSWERLIVLRNFGLKIRGTNSKITEFKDDFHEDKISIDSDALCISVPYGLVVYQLFEGIVNSFKSLKQLHHQFKTENDEYILSPKAENPKKIPKIKVQSKVINIRLDDDPFEARLGLIFKVGLQEMKAREAREAAFDAKVKTLKAAQAKEKDEEQSHEKDEQGEQSERGEQDEQVEKDANGLNGEHSIKPMKAHGEKRKFKPMRSRGLHRSGRKFHGVRPIRYAPKEAALPSEEASISIEAAYNKLQELHSQAWIKRISRARKSRAETIESRRLKLIGPDDVDEDIIANERILAIPDAPPLFEILFDDANIVLDHPSFSMEDVPKFIYDVGKGIPMDTKYTLLIPFFWKFQMSEGRLLLRDYPLPMIHVPPLSGAHAGVGTSWTLTGDFVIAEEIFDNKSERKVPVSIVEEFNGTEGYSIVVTRTVSPVKLYSKINVDIASTAPTRITWAPSLQPAIQQTMAIFDTFTKPPVDPSEKIGFWDKIRLIFHSNIKFTWNEGSVHLLLKGSRDPYMITGAGAGFAMCWSNNVTWSINPSGDQKEFMVVDSENFVLGIPDFTYFVRQNLAFSYSLDDTQSSSSTSSNYTENASLKKVIMKLSGNVRWQAGLLFERDQQHNYGKNKRTFESIPHYKVQLVTPQNINSSLGKHDSYAGFRSNYIHLALSVLSPRNRKWTALKNVPPSLTSYNTVHLSPKAFTHFFEWWGLFAGNMSLPIKSGKLFTNQDEPSKKFGRHLATIKYQFVLEPLFISHMYLHKRLEDWEKKSIHSIGLKGRTDSFMMDLHQRREITTYMDHQLNIQRSRRHMKLNVGEVDFHSADIRVVTVIFKERSPEELFNQISSVSGTDSPTGSTSSTPLLGKFKVKDNDLTWVDMDDFIEVDSLISSHNLSTVKVLPWLYAPRITYYRRTEHDHGKESPDSEKVSTFGNEPSHDCLLGQVDIVEFQTKHINKRARELEEQLKWNKEQMDDLQKSARVSTDNHAIRMKYIEAQKVAEMLHQKKVALHQLWFSVLESAGNGNEFIKKCADEKVNGTDEECLFKDDGLLYSENVQNLRGLENSRLSDFNNRFMFHNVQLKWNNSIRNNLLRYSHQVGRRRGVIYYMSRRAVKFIEDMVKNSSNHSDIDLMEENEIYGTKEKCLSGEMQFLKDREKKAMEQANKLSNSADRYREVTENMIEKLLNDSKDNFVVENETPSVGKQPRKKEHQHLDHSHQRKLSNIGENMDAPERLDESDMLQVPSESTLDKSKSHSSKSSSFMNFNDLSGASEMIENLQREIRQLEEIRMQFQIYTTELDQQGWFDRRKVLLELANAREELFFIMKAITTEQRRMGDKHSSQEGVLQWFITGKQMIAHLLLADRTPFVDVAFANATFRRLENANGSNFNTIEIDMLQGINLLRDALYPELLSPYFDGMKESDAKRKAVKVYWYMLEAIGGISVMDHFEINLIPLKIQLEHDIGQKLFEYIFPNDSPSPFIVPERPAKASVTVAVPFQGPSNNISVIQKSEEALSLSSDSSSDSEAESSIIRSANGIFGRKSKNDSEKANNGKSVKANKWVDNIRHRTASHRTSDSSLRESFYSRDPIPKAGDNASISSLVSTRSDSSRTNLLGRNIAVTSEPNSQLMDDDLSQMVSRASSFMSFVYVTIPSTILCISYKGKGSRSIEDLHEFVFRLPDMEYRNKTWSNLDLVTRMKKDIIKALISHTGALIENKLKFRGSSSKKRKQPPIIRQISNYASFTSLADLSVMNVSSLNRAEGSDSKSDEK